MSRQAIHNAYRCVSEHVKLFVFPKLPHQNLFIAYGTKPKHQICILSV